MLALVLVFVLVLALVLVQRDQSFFLEVLCRDSSLRLSISLYLSTIANFSLAFPFREERFVI